jgi:hypothetical protein
MTSTTKQFSPVTPYRAAQIATAILHDVGVLPMDETIEPQTFYSNKTIKRTDDKKKSEGGPGLRFEGASFNEWLQAAKKGTGTVRVTSSLNALLAEYAEDSDVEDVDPEVQVNEDDNAAQAETFEEVTAKADTSALTEDAELAALEDENESE